MLLDTPEACDVGTFELARDRKLCRPSKGRSLGATVVAFGKPVHLAVQRLIQSAKSQVGKGPLFQVLKSREAVGAVPESSTERLAWFTVNVGLLYAVCHRTARLSPLSEGISWFFKGRHEYVSELSSSFEERGLDDAEVLLSRLLIDDAFLDLLPYILEPHGHVTRGHLERSVLAAETRSRKRHAGVYYTPSDVAEFMVRGLVDDDACRTWIDPACGTAVFLREVVRGFMRRAKSCRSALEYCTQFIYGLDISPLATESSAFVLLAECAHSESIEQPSPFDAWLAIARNIQPCDATHLHCGRSGSLVELDDGVNFASTARMFPHTDGRFDRVVMNPPYSTLLIDNVRKASYASFGHMTVGATGNASVAFVEMMWKLAKPHGAAAAVVPLSVGASSHGQFKACRRAIRNAGGAWEFLFFDREPHALFGEDIKTRNAILFRHGSCVPIELRTSRMLKWTSALRPKIFTRDRTTRISDRGIENFIPKLGTDAEARLYETIQDSPKVSGLRFKLSRTTLAEIARCEDDRTVAVGGSAYNFLNAFLPSALRDTSTSGLSESPLHALIFNTSKDRDIGYAILSSALAFWLWHTEGDGFHVTADFVSRLPLWREEFLKASSTELAELGRAAWREAVATRVRSVNGGKSTYSFHCPFNCDTVRTIDQVLLSRLEGQQQANVVLASFIAETVSIDGKERRRIALPRQR